MRTDGLKERYEMIKSQKDLLKEHPDVQILYIRMLEELCEDSISSASLYESCFQKQKKKYERALKKIKEMKQCNL